MGKACDRCGKVNGKSNLSLQVKIKGVIKKYIQSIDRVILRRMEGVQNPEFEYYEIAGKKDFCEDCLESFAKWLDTKEAENAIEDRK